MWYPESESSIKPPVYRKGPAEQRCTDWKPVYSVDFDQNCEPITTDYSGAAAGSCTTQQGDTLSSVAVGLWGDGQMGSLIAEPPRVVF